MHLNDWTSWSHITENTLYGTEEILFDISNETFKYGQFWSILTMWLILTIVIFRFNLGSWIFDKRLWWWGKGD